MGHMILAVTWILPLQHKSNHRQNINNEYGYALIKLDSWAVRFDFHIIIINHEINFFFELFQLFKIQKKFLNHKPQKTSNGLNLACELQFADLCHRALRLCFIKKKKKKLRIVHGIQQTFPNVLLCFKVHVICLKRDFIYVFPQKIDYYSTGEIL